MKILLLGMILFGSSLSFGNEEILLDANCKAKCVLRDSEYRQKISFVYVDYKGVSREWIDKENRSDLQSKCEGKADINYSVTWLASEASSCLFFKH